jgi:hypothetical protein
MGSNPTASPRNLVEALDGHHNPQFGIQWEDLTALILDRGLGGDITQRELQRSGAGFPATALVFMVFLLACADAGSFNTFTTPP